MIIMIIKIINVTKNNFREIPTKSNLINIYHYWGCFLALPVGGGILGLGLGFRLYLALELVFCVVEPLV